MHTEQFGMHMADGQGQMTKLECTFYPAYLMFWLRNTMLMGTAKEIMESLKGMFGQLSFSL